MRPSRFTEEQIIGMLKEQEAGVAVSDLCRKHGISDASVPNDKTRRILGDGFGLYFGCGGQI